MTPLTFLFAASLTAITLGVIDHRSGRMPNSLTLSSLVCALLGATAWGGFPGFLYALLGALLVGGAPALLYFSTHGQAIGGGDIKALAALGAWLGPSLGLHAELLAFCLLAGAALLSEIKRGRPMALIKSWLLPNRSSHWGASSPPLAARQVRFGPYLALATLITSVAN